MDDEGGVDWVGGSTYQKEVFVYLYGALSASAAVEKRMKQDSLFVSISDESCSALLERVRPVILDGHPWIQVLFDDLCLPH